MNCEIGNDSKRFGKKKKKKKHSGGTEKGIGGCDFTNPFMMIRLIGFVLGTE